jgi:type IV pilus assembly protein PilB
VIREPKTPLLEPPVVRIQQLVFSEAVRLSASDIHVDPGDRFTRIRFRVDGRMQEGFEIPGWLHDRLLARIKIMARLDISERRLPQDGHLADRERGLEARLSTLPTHRGEAAVIRLFGGGSSLPTLADLGGRDSMEDQLRVLCHRPQGILLVVGPTGIGKTTTLYAIIDELRSSPLNIVTIEDPIEYRVDGIRQVQVDDRSGLSFEASLRSILRQDPDVILVGEIRDGETARIAFNAALTGHLVLSTLHATDTASAVVRLVELGVDRYLVSSALIGVIAPRLVRRNCPNCLRPDSAPTQYGERLGLDAAEHRNLRRSYGCVKCRFTSCAGRVALFEMLEISERIRPHIAGGREDEFMKVARNMGFVSLLDQAIDLVLAGDVSVEEAYRTCYFGDAR